MSWKNVLWQGQMVGQKFERDGYLLFFGNRHLHSAQISAAFPDVQPRFLKQIHSGKVIESSLNLVEADAHWTKATQAGLVISTADCLPILGYTRKMGAILAIHAGWRGIAENVIGNALAALPNRARADFHFWIGPHIHADSFEVHNDVADQILAAVTDKGILKPHSDPNKSHVDLAQAAKIQLARCGVNPSRVLISRVNTFTHSDFNSYRRNQAVGRQLSFVARMR